jgi:hypothetical protein
LLDSADQFGDGGTAVPITVADGYDGTNANYRDKPGPIIWHFELADS